MFTKRLNLTTSQTSSHDLFTSLKFMLFLSSQILYKTTKKLRNWYATKLWLKNPEAPPPLRINLYSRPITNQTTSFTESKGIEQTDKPTYMVKVILQPPRV